VNVVEPLSTVRRIVTLINVPEVGHFCHTDFAAGEVADYRTLMIMEMRFGDGTAHLEAGSGVGEIPDGRLYEP
jgi:hypothetical protein